MGVFEFSSYKDFIRFWIKSQPKKGRGCIKAISEKLKINPALLSQILHSKRNVTLEQAHGLAEIFALEDLEREYFITLIEMAKNNSTDLVGHFQKRLDRIKKLTTTQTEDALFIKKLMSEPAMSFQYAIRHEDIPKIKEVLNQSVSQINQIIADSDKPDAVMIFNLDLFRIY